MDIDPQQQRYRFELLDPLDGIYMSSSDREYARAALDRAEWIADRIVGAACDLRASAATFIRRGGRVLAGRTAAALGKTS